MQNTTLDPGAGGSMEEAVLGAPPPKNSSIGYDAQHN